MGKDKEIQICNRPEGVESLHVALERIGEAWKISQRDLLELNLILEEICVNHMVHGKGRVEDHITVRLCKESAKILCTVITHGPAFDPLTVLEPDVHLPLAQRKAGGLGIHLVRRYADGLSYTRERGTNRLVIEKILSSEF